MTKDLPKKVEPWWNPVRVTIEMADGSSFVAEGIPVEAVIEQDVDHGHPDDPDARSVVTERLFTLRLRRVTATVGRPPMVNPKRLGSKVE